MAEEQKRPAPPDLQNLPRYCSLLDIEFTDEDEAILDRIWEEIPITEEENREAEEFFATWIPFSRGDKVIRPRPEQ
ncbi:MAG: hypothetical protein RMI90_05990 [Thermoguttaceae bacterium]|nr:hypothetical protein [Thermoguttaceae bacterium]